ncbi:MAG: hypothetical protein MI866_04660, partial [Bacteroidales bacterium]|nr:hypothetical protein [Bacteroidales bacterium]
LNLEGMDLPRAYIVVAKRILSADSVKALPYDHTNFSTLKSTAHRKKWSDEKLIGFLQRRYKGHPEHASFLADIMLDSNRTDEAIDLLKSVIENDHSDWNAHDRLGELLIQESKYIDADNVYSNYSGFNSDVNSQRVHLSNNAYLAGNRFYWRGRYDEAKKFYSIAGSLDTGAESGYASLQRLAMMSHDYQTALEYSFRRGKRYNSVYGYRDYLVMMHLLGAHKDAISGFTSLVSRYKKPPIWTSLLIGQRIESGSETNYHKLVGDILENAPEFMKIQAARYVFLNNITDRLPTKTDLSDFPEIQSHPKQRQSVNNVMQKITQELGIKKSTLKCEYDKKECQEDKNDVSTVPVNSNRFNKYKNYLDAYIDFKNSEYDKAFEKYLRNNKAESILTKKHEYSQNGKLNTVLNTNHTLPYLAMSALKSDKGKFLQSLKKSIKGIHLTKESAFDVLLTESVISASEKQWDKSLDYLKQAFNRRPHTKWRPIYSWYQITEISEWLYLLSNDKRFIDLALDWAKNYQVIQPQFSWAYAFEALYSDNKQNKIKAAAFALYLDRDSYWLSKVPHDIKLLGKEWWKINNPFKIDAMSQQNEASI